MPIVEIATVESTSLARIIYGHLRAQLTVEFRARTTYCYEGVPPELFAHLDEASSRGAFFNRQIRGQFPCARTADES